MTSLIDLRKFRLEKLKKLKKLGIDPYPPYSKKTCSNEEIHIKYPDYEGKEIAVSGRITSIRSHGGLVFVDLKDASGKIQVYIKEQNLVSPDRKKGQLGFLDIELLDTGDFLEAGGKVFKTKRGEISIEANYIKILTKALRPLPDQWDGLKDKETRLRKRYIDTNINSEVFQRFIRRAKFWEAHREYFKKEGFLEINIPILENTPGGADANPFITHMDVLDQDFYLRISQELYLKRLIGGGYEKVYEIGPRFRNEGYSDEHLPEHIAMEFYWAYADWKKGMDFIISLFRYVAESVYNTGLFKTRGFEFDLSQEWETIEYSDILKKRFGINIFDTDLKEVKSALEKENAKIKKGITVNRAIDDLWKIARKEIRGPAMVIHEPKFLSPLAKTDPENDNLTLRFHPIIAGSELGNGFSELNDPQDQLKRFVEQQKMRDKGDKEAQFLDTDFVEMLEYGMPPTFGYGHSERVFWFLENVPAREGVPFPQLKKENDSDSRKILGL